jgi:hypothetical protein
MGERFFSRGVEVIMIDERIFVMCGVNITIEKVAAGNFPGSHFLF